MEKFFELLTQMNPFDLVQVLFWGLAGAISFYFSIGNARVWTSISIGFFLIFLSQAYGINPWGHYQKLTAFHSIVGIVAIMIITHGFLEYYVFCRTFEISGNKLVVYIGTIAFLLVSSLFLILNPVPSPNTIRNFKMVENAIWVILCIMNLEVVRKIYTAIKGSDISRGFIAFGLVFICILVWKSSDLYLQIFQWDKDWQEILTFMTDESSDVEDFMGRVTFFQDVSRYAGLLSGISVGGAFTYVFRLLR
jgi:hypothetical protein